MERLSHSTVKVKMGAFKSGIANEQVHHWTNLKPAQMRPDAVEAEMVPEVVQKRPDQPTSTNKLTNP